MAPYALFEAQVTECLRQAYDRHHLHLGEGGESKLKMAGKDETDLRTVVKVVLLWA